MKTFWDSLPRPFFCLAPMEGITDAAFRRVIALCGKPDVIYTEFSSVDGLVSEAGRPKICADLQFDDIERPIVAQLFGNNPKLFKEAARIIAELGFDGIDINMGCPDKDVVKQGAGANLITDPKLAQEIIFSTKAGAGEKPVSVKTRLGFSSNEVESWIPELIKAKPAAITIHGRTRKQRFGGEADWETIAQAKAMAKNSGIPIIGNGDIRSREQGVDLARLSGVDGLMVGRAVFGDPWFFNPKVKKEDLPLEQILEKLVDHAGLFQELLGEHHRFVQMRTHIAHYLKGYPNTKDLKLQLMAANTAAEIQLITDRYSSRPNNKNAPSAAIM